MDISILKTEAGNVIQKCIMEMGRMVFVGYCSISDDLHLKVTVVQCQLSSDMHYTMPICNLCIYVCIIFQAIIAHVSLPQI